MNSEAEFKKKNVAIMVVLSILTLGIYIGYWFLSRKGTFYSYKDNYIPLKWWVVFTVYLSLSFIHMFVGPFIFTPYGMAAINSFDVVLSFYFMGILYFSVFRVKEMIEQETKEENFKPWLLVLFHIWYLQFKINRLYESRGDFNVPEKTLSE